MKEYHQHDGTDQTQIDPKRDMLGFPVFSLPPTGKAQEGTMVFVSDGTYKYTYVMLNHVWTLMATAFATLTALATLNFGAISPSSSADLTMALTGATDGNIVAIGMQNAVISTGTNCDNISFFAWVSAPNVVTIRCVNNSAVNTANPASGIFKVTTIQL